MRLFPPTIFLAGLLAGCIHVTGAPVAPPTERGFVPSDFHPAPVLFDARSQGDGRLDLAVSVTRQPATETGERRTLALAGEIAHLMVRLFVDGRELSPAEPDAATGLPGYRVPVTGGRIPPLTWVNLPVGQCRITLKALGVGRQVLNADPNEGDAFEANVQGHRATVLQCSLRLKDTTVAGPTGSLHPAVTLVNGGTHVYEGALDASADLAPLTFTEAQLGGMIGKAYTAWASLAKAHPEFAEPIGPAEVAVVTDDAANPGQPTMILSILDQGATPPTSLRQKLYFDASAGPARLTAVSSLGPAPADVAAVAPADAVPFAFRRSAEPEGAPGRRDTYLVPSQGRSLQLFVGLPRAEKLTGTLSSDGTLLGLALWTDADNRVLRIERLSP